LKRVGDAIRDSGAAMGDRPAIPADLERQLMIEAGFRCAMPNCHAVEPLEIEHIDDFANVGKHEFANMIVLCSNCHRRKRDTNNPRHINRLSLTKIKQNLMLLNGRYSDLERRILEEMRNIMESDPDRRPAVLIHHTMELLARYLVHDGLVTSEYCRAGMVTGGPHGIMITNDQFLLVLTAKGREFIENLNVEN
jgi:HNH endonuclease